MDLKCLGLLLFWFFEIYKPVHQFIISSVCFYRMQPYYTCGFSVFLLCSCSPGLQTELYKVKLWCMFINLCPRLFGFLPICNHLAQRCRYTLHAGGSTWCCLILGIRSCYKTVLVLINNSWYLFFICRWNEHLRLTKCHSCRRPTYCATMMQEC